MYKEFKAEEYQPFINKLDAAFGLEFLPNRPRCWRASSVGLGIFYLDISNKDDTFVFELWEAEFDTIYFRFTFSLIDFSLFRTEVFNTIDSRKARRVVLSFLKFLGVSQTFDQISLFFHEPLSAHDVAIVLSESG